MYFRKTVLRTKRNCKVISSLIVLLKKL